MRTPTRALILASILATAGLAGCAGAGSSASVSGASATPATTPPITPTSTLPSTPLPTPSEVGVTLYFGRSDLDLCTEVVPVQRIVAEATPEAALRALLKGPTAAETAAGYQSWFSTRTADALESVHVKDGIAEVSFQDLRLLIPNASSSCGSGLLLDELDSTLGQFPELSAVRYSIQGDVAAFYEWLQRGVPPR